MSKRTGTPPNHDTLTCYCNYDCRLPECVDRYRTWNNARRKAHRRGDWQSHVDAEPVREHLQLLAKHGISLFRAAQAAGIGHTSLHPLFQQTHAGRRGRQHTVTTDIAAKVLALDPEALKAAYSDPTGTVRRIQALVAIGWPMYYLAEDLGVSPAYVSALIQRSAKGRPIRTSTADSVAAAYERLKGRRLSRAGVSTHSANRARRYAAANQWPPPKYWDDPDHPIDDPDFEPLYGVSAAEILAQEAHWLMTAGGLSLDLAAERLGKSRSYVEKSLKDHPQDGRAAA